MWHNFLTPLLADQDDGSGLYRLLPIIIITALYALSGLLKKKEQKKKQQKRPTPKTTRRQETLPTYARRKPQPPTGRKPAPTMPRPRPVPTRRTSTETPVPIEIIPEPVGRRPPPIPVPSAQRKKSARAPKAAAATEHAIAQVRAKAKQQMLSTAEAGKLSKVTRRGEKIIASAQKDVTADRLNLALGKKSALVRAIVYAEILGKPMGLKPRGGYELE